MLAIPTVAAALVLGADLDGRTLAAVIEQTVHGAEQRKERCTEVLRQSPVAGAELTLVIYVLWCEHYGKPLGRRVTLAALVDRMFNIRGRYQLAWKEGANYEGSYTATDGGFDLEIRIGQGVDPQGRVIHSDSQGDLLSWRHVYPTGTLGGVFGVSERGNEFRYHVRGRFVDAETGEELQLDSSAPGRGENELEAREDALRKLKVSYRSPKRPSWRVLDFVSASWNKRAVVVAFGSNGPQYRITILPSGDRVELRSERVDGTEKWQRFTFAPE